METNQAIIDNLILGLSAGTALLLTRLSKEKKVGAVAAFFLLFCPLVIFLNMWAHTTAVVVVNYKRYLAGSFRYTFHFYSLLLFGIVFIVTGRMSIAAARKRIFGDRSQNTRILWLNAGTAALFLPMAFINPIALLPVIASVISSITVWLIRPAGKAAPKVLPMPPFGKAVAAE